MTAVNRDDRKGLQGAARRGKYVRLMAKRHKCSPHPSRVLENAFRERGRAEADVRTAPSCLRGFAASRHGTDWHCLGEGSSPGDF